MFASSSKEERIEKDIMTSSSEQEEKDVNSKTAKKVNVSKNTVQRARAFVMVVLSY